MAIRTGDSIFLRNGSPVIVLDRNPATGKLIVENEQKEVQKATRHGYLNGMTQEVRKELYEILDQVKGENQEPKARVEALQAKLAEFEKDPTKFWLTRYVKAEMVHIMNTHGIKPREYTVPVENIGD